MADVRDWSTTPASNTDLAPEGMAPGGLNDAIRAVQAEIAQLNADGAGTATTGGTSTAYTLTLSTSPASLSDGLNFSFTANVTSGASATLNVNSFGAKKLRKFTNGAEEDLAAGDLVANGHYQVQYDSAANGGSGAFIVLNPVDAAAPARLISSGSVSAAATLDLTLPSGYRDFQLILSEFEPAAAGSALSVRISFDSGSTYKAGASDYDYAATTIDTAGTAGSFVSAAATSIAIMGAQAIASGAGGEATIYLSTPDTSGHFTTARFQSGYRSNSSSALTMAQGGGRCKAVSTRATNLRLLYGSGNISAGRYQLYGLRN